MNNATTTKDVKKVDRGQLTVDRGKDVYEGVRYPYLSKCIYSQKLTALT